MVGWRSAVCVDGVEHFMFFQTVDMALCIVFRMSEAIAKAAGAKPNDWGFQCRQGNGEYVHLFFDASLSIEEIKRRAERVMSDLIRDNETLH